MKTIRNWLALLLITVAVSVASDKTVIRVGHFPNITHVQGLVAHNLSRQGKGWFEARLGPDIEIQWFTYNAGPSAMEAIFAKTRRCQIESKAMKNSVDKINRFILQPPLSRSLSGRA